MYLLAGAQLPDRIKPFCLLSCCPLTLALYFCFCCSWMDIKPQSVFPVAHNWCVAVLDWCLNTEPNHIDYYANIVALHLAALEKCAQESCISSSEDTAKANWVSSERALSAHREGTEKGRFVAKWRWLMRMGRRDERHRRAKRWVGEVVWAIVRLFTLPLHRFIAI